MSTSRQPTRRQFLKLAGATTMLGHSATTLAAQDAKPVAPSDRIRVALLGAGGCGGCSRGCSGQRDSFRCRSDQSRALALRSAQRSLSV